MDKSLKIAVILSAIDKMSSVINSGINGSIKKMDQLAERSKNMSKKAFDFAEDSAKVGLAIAAPLGLAVKAAAEYERMNIALKTSFQGNDAAAQKAFKEINKFAAQTPYELEEVMTGFIKLKNMGLEPGQKALTAYGNIASGMGKSLNDMVEAVADAATGEFERLKEFGIKAKTQGDTVAFTFQGVTTKVKKNSKEIEQYLQMVGNTKFKGGIEAQSKSIIGQFSTLKDNANALMVKIGNTLVPMVNRLFKAITPVIDKIANWIDKNPELVATITKVAAGAAALALAASGVSFIFGGVLKVVSVLSTGFGIFFRVLGFVSSAMSFLGTVVRIVSAIMMANPIILIITLIAGAAMLIYKYWEPIKNFFINLWEGTKRVFKQAWDWIINLPFMKPIKMIIENWDKIKAFFGDLWEGIKAKFKGFMDFILGLPRRMFQAGVNIIKSIWDGIKSMVSKPIDAIKGMVGKIRDHLPFSPAKVGPLRDIHRIKLVETIAENIKPGPMVKAMRNTAAATMIAATPVSGAKSATPVRPAAAGGGGAVSVSYSPTITVSGGNKQDFERMLKEHSGVLIKMIEEAQRKNNRTKF